MSFNQIKIGYNSNTRVCFEITTQPYHYVSTVKGKIYFDYEHFE